MGNHGASSGKGGYGPPSPNDAYYKSQGGKTIPEMRKWAREADGETLLQESYDLARSNSYGINSEHIAVVEQEMERRGVKSETFWRYYNMESWSGANYGENWQEVASLRRDIIAQLDKKRRKK